MSNFLKLGDMRRNMGVMLTGGTSKNMQGQFCDLQMYFPVI